MLLVSPPDYEELPVGASQELLHGKQGGRQGDGRQPSEAGKGGDHLDYYEDKCTYGR